MDNDPVINQLVRSVYSPNSTSFQTQNAVRSFKEAAGIPTGHGIENDKWLQTLSVDSALQAIASAFRNTNSLNFEGLSKPAFKTFESLCLEKSSTTSDTSLERLLTHIIGQQQELEALSCLTKIFNKLNQRLMPITPETLLKIFDVYPKALSICYEDYKSACSGKSKNHWMIASSFQSPKLYTKFCDYMLKNSLSDLPSFVSLCLERGNLFTLYSGNEQSIVFLIETTENCGSKTAKDLTVTKIIEKLLEMLQTNSGAASKLLQQFPCLGEWIVELSDESEAAQQVCLWILTRDCE